MPLLFTTYAYFGCKENSINGYLLGVASASIFALFQWTEAIQLSSHYLSVENIVHNFGMLKFGIAQPSGSVTTSEIFTNGIRVSGSTSKPSLLSQILLLSLPMFVGHPILMSIIFLGIMLSISKVTFVLGFAGLAIYILWRLRIGSFAILLTVSLAVYIFAAQLLIEKFETRKQILNNNPSIYMRVLPIFFYEEMPLKNKIFGVGKYGSCKLASPIWHEETVTKSGYIDFERQENCFLTNFSSIGSLLVDYGVVDVFAIGTLFTFLPVKKNFTIKAAFLKNRTSLLCFWWFLSFLNIYILTFVPAAYFFLGWVLARDDYD